MAKNLSGELHVASANRLADGAVVYLDDAALWTTRLDRAAVARDKRAAELLLERAQAQVTSAVDLLLVAVVESDDGTIDPLSLREKIRASGLTFAAIAADAVRYA
jgi:hypothetical protein